MDDWLWDHNFYNSEALAKLNEGSTRYSRQYCLEITLGRNIGSVLQISFVQRICLGQNNLISDVFE